MLFASLFLSRCSLFVSSPLLYYFSKSHSYTLFASLFMPQLLIRQAIYWLSSTLLNGFNQNIDIFFYVQEDFYAVVDWAYKIDPLRCISMHGNTERYLSGQKADAAGFVRKLLDDLESRISMQFNKVYATNFQMHSTLVL